MKKILLTALMGLSIISCTMDGYSEYTLTSVSNFDYDASNYTDSLVLNAQFYGGSQSSSLVFNSARPETGAEMTGGFGLTMKRDSSLTIKSDNLYPQYTMYTSSATIASWVKVVEEETGITQDIPGCAVFYQNEDPSLMPEHDITFFNADNGTCNPSYCRINNTQLTVYNVLGEDAPYKFEPGDWLKLKITGTRNNVETGSVEYYLADWRGGGEKPDSVLTSWKTVSLSRLGEIEHVDFTLESSKEGFPAGFCMNRFVSSVYLKF